ncbi:uncharacterized protein Tco025E_01099 [Trypanosoma conorhini]|uniref:PIN domain-containing protein n=1 Tax=Trypanosoma conorhini TaxID=83891 RepID=A0A422Q9R6_9TRYP|nr:uncharacterized protein Tco025E_01099 [Trypanosoma conorhini]RNF26701.1 hypothetical protein Tco025E_01099 [Trypanosoma conorhini]
MSHTMGYGVAHAQPGQGPQQQRIAPAALEAYPARVDSRNENSAGGFTYGGVAGKRPGLVCLPPETLALWGLAKRLPEETPEEGPPRFRRAPFPAAAVAGEAGATRAVAAVALTPKQETPLPLGISPLRLRSPAQSGNQLVRDPLEVLQLYSRRCEEVESRTGGVPQAGAQESGTTHAARAVPDTRAVWNGHHEVGQAAAERSAVAEAWAQRYALPTAYPQANQAPPKSKAAAAATLRAKRAERVFNTKRIGKSGGRSWKGTNEMEKQFPVKQPSPSRVVSWPAFGSAPVRESHRMPRLTELRAFVAGKEGAPPPRARVGHLPAKKGIPSRTPAQVNSLSSRLEELRQHVEKYNASKEQMAARPLPLQNVDIAQGSVAGWSAAAQRPLAPVATSAAKMQPCGVARGMVSEASPHGPLQFPCNAGRGVDALVSPAPLASNRNRPHFVFDTCSLLRADESILRLALERGVVCIPFDVVAELDGINRGKGNRQGGKAYSKQRQFEARRVRDWISGAIESGANVRVQRRCEVEALYDRKVATKDDSILGFAVFLEQQQLPVKFVTNDKFLRVKAIAELKGAVYDLDGFERHLLY